MKDVYEELVEMICTEGFRVGPGMKTPELDEILRLQYTPEEAWLAVRIRTTGGKLDELVAKTSMDRTDLDAMLRTMAQKGTVWIDPGSEDPVYRALMIESPGLIETAAWISDEFSWQPELRKRWSSYKHVYVAEGVTKLGPALPTWASVLALPVDALPDENIAERIKQLDFVSIARCCCRDFEQFGEPETECDHPLETCMICGDIGRWAVQNGFAREITHDEAVQILHDCAEAGLVHSGSPDFGFLCNCCKHACVNLAGMKQGLPHVMVPSPFITVCSEESCTECLMCEDRCPVGAVHVDDSVQIDGIICIGCGVCVAGCPQDAMKLVRREASVADDS